MQQTNIYSDIARRTGGDIYIGVVGPVRTGKSTFIKRFMESTVLDRIESRYKRERAIDELPQSAGGKTIMTTEPKFVPEEAVSIDLDEGVSMNVRMIDCVGYIIPSSLGYIENEQPRMVMTPWFENEIPFNMAAEIGTRKVITEHSTIGLVVTTDGSITDLPREEYEEAEERVINELLEINKPFVVLLNSVYPTAESTKALAEELSERYGVPVLPKSCVDLTESDIREILATVLYRFPVREILFSLPRWIISLGSGHWLKDSIVGAISNCAKGADCVSSVRRQFEGLLECEYIESVKTGRVDLGSGSVHMQIVPPSALFYRILSETSGIPIADESALMPFMLEMAEIRRQWEKVQGALEEVSATGYGIVMPSLDELKLEEPEIVKQGGRYGVRLRASAPSIHMMRAEINTEVSPIVGSEKQSEELVMYLLKEFEESPEKIWESNIFGKSLHDLVNEGLHNKLYRMPGDARMRLQETIERIINEGCGGLICIIL